MSNPERMIRGVLFDLDDTLYDRTELVLRIAREQTLAFREQLDGIDPASFMRRLIELDAHGYGSKPAAYARIVSELGLPQALAEPLERHFWETYDALCEPAPETQAVLGALRAQGLKLGVVTNGRSGRQALKLERLGIAPLFDAVLISQSEGVRKPEPAIFERALARCGVAAGEAVFVGDHPENDVAGARSAGLTAVWKRVPHWKMTLPDVRAVDTLSEILPLLTSRGT
jgi:putative hydrolase of the HAD superfamily